METLPIISLTRLAIGFVPTILVLVVMYRWSLEAGKAFYANARMLAQLLAVGYVLTYIFETDSPLLIVLVIGVMISVSSWIALRPLTGRGLNTYLIVLLALGSTGTAVLGLISQLVLDLPRWFEPNYVVPLAGMIYANAMNTVSLAAERFEAETNTHGLDYTDARRVALGAALIPQINSLLAVGLVALPGMMTGQILSGVDPIVAARYQIMVMSMIFGSAGLAAALYLALKR